MRTISPPIKVGEDDIAWIDKYIQNAAPSGNEMNGQKMWLDYVRPFADKCFTDVYGNAAAVINPDEEFKVVIEAHADEIGWYVHTITSDGFLHVEKNGGSDPGIAPSQKVRIHTSDAGVVPAIFGWPAIHTRGKSSAAQEPKPDTIFIDCGCNSKEEVEELGIQIGDSITYDSGLGILNEQYLVGRSQDNKIGGFIIASVAKILRQQNLHLPFALYVVNSVQEEVGLKGAAMMANAIKPNCAIVTDVTHATHTPMVNRNKVGDVSLDSGPVIVKSPAVHNKLRNHIVGIARECQVPFQLAVSSRKTGTDTDSFAYASKPVPAALISVPMRYMHTTVETTSISDIENTLKLLMHVVASLKPDFNFYYL